MGTPEFAGRPLTALCHSEHEVLAVVTGPDKPSGRGRKFVPTVCKTEAQRQGVRVFAPALLSDEQLYRDLEALAPDLFVVIAFRILPRRLFELPRLGSINIHASLLPKYRGAAPIHWALINGEAETGLTSFFLKRKVDTGDIIHRQILPIDPDDTYDSLSERLSEAAGGFLLDTLTIIESGRKAPQPQDEAEATPAPKLGPVDALIDFGLPAENVRNFVRGLATRPGAYTFYRGKRLKIFGCEVASEAGLAGAHPGTLHVDSDRLLVACGREAVALRRLVPEGRKEMDGKSFINGFKPRSGELFEPKQEG
jgi:methionyl-tRNA formyltransferase